MLTLYRRHTRSCGQKDRYYRRCKCPVWVEGTANAGNYIRRSLKLASWERGEERKRELEAGPTPVASQANPRREPPERITVREATEEFCNARNA
jgi:integrase/recombinase XerD